MTLVPFFNIVIELISLSGMSTSANRDTYEEDQKSNSKLYFQKLIAAINSDTGALVLFKHITPKKGASASSQQVVTEQE